VVSLRSARPEDAAAVAAVHVRSWQVGYRGLLPDDYLAGLRPEDRMGRYTFGSTDPDAPWTTVAVENDVICGFATTGGCPDDDTSHAGQLFALYVDPDTWGVGVGRRLMAAARAQLHRRRFTEGVLWVLVGNDRAQRFYAIDGWVADGGRRTEEVWGVSVDEIRYRRHLP
jgi:ribosomal protein S18 acetylase RimI-like enzyme